MSTGTLKIHVFQENTYKPLKDANITVMQENVGDSGQNIHNLVSDSSGVAKLVDIITPPREYSIKPSNNRPYSLCTITVDNPGYKKLIIKGCQILPDEVSIQYCNLQPKIERQDDDEEVINILPNVLEGGYQRKIPENDEPNPFEGISFYIPPSMQANPNFILVHAGSPEDSRARNHRVDFKHYIKNVLASEIYSTWPREAIKANAIAVMSFALNRIFTEWYWGRHGFHITNSTAYDQMFNPGRNTFASIDEVVDELFTTYVEKANYIFPVLTQYTDGRRVPSPPGWMSQWGSQELATRGKTCEEILRFYYGRNIWFHKKPGSGNLSPSYPGYVLKLGAEGEAVKTIQTSLNAIAMHYPLITGLIVDGTFGNSTKESVKTFQDIFSIPVTGSVDFKTWYKISDVYVAIVR